ncbi:MAG: 1-acyl-sn-glycerol-3-phosphate acyltransferase [Candidatus Cloacimonetes bacterium]|nr:1-acyl-sn-glycerol-3-phosphate acyltransferase [Candidatus Cloacimonadota bacterium]
MAKATNCLICANHISANDPPFIGTIIPFKVNFLAKIELFRNPLMAKILWKVKAIPIRRGRIDRRALQEVEKRLAQGESIVIFPEGTRKSNKVKAGTGKFALEMKKDILPIYIENSNDVLGCIFGKKNLRITVGDFIKSESFQDMEATKENYQLLADEVMKKINELKDRN